LFPFALVSLAAVIHVWQDKSLQFLLPLLSAALFVVCVVCHGELARSKPDPEQLTSFYLCLSLGGALGGLAVALVSPRIFNANYENPAVLTLCMIVVIIALWRARSAWVAPPRRLALWSLAALALAYYSGNQLHRNVFESRLLARNFYGALRVDQLKDEFRRNVRQLNHGGITHGTQILDPHFRQSPTTYYGRESGAGLAWRTFEPEGPIRMGVIGLGAGTLAAYGRAGDSIHFYEINPLVVDIAKTQFTYLSDTPAHTEITLGDARLSLEQQPSQQFDILVVDAFSGDAIPVHLLTQECFRVYWKHLKSNGILAVHISNRFLDLGPVVASAAEASNKAVGSVDNDDDDKLGVYDSTYVLITSRPGFFATHLLKNRVSLVTIPAHFHRWTDDYSNLFQLLRFD
jgi:hypothetical protein